MLKNFSTDGRLISCLDCIMLLHQQCHEFKRDALADEMVCLKIWQDETLPNQ